MLTSGHSPRIFFFTTFLLGVAMVAMVATGPTPSGFSLVTPSGPTTRGSTTTTLPAARGARRGVPCTAYESNSLKRVCPRDGLPMSRADEAAARRRSPRFSLHLKPAAKSVATCTAAALSRYQKG